MTFDHAKWLADQRRQQAQDNKFAKQMAALAKKSTSSAGTGTGRTVKKFATGRATRGQGSWIRQGLSQALSFQQHSGSLNAIPYAKNQEGAIHLDSNLLESDPERQVEELRLEAKRHPRTREKLCFLHWSISLNPRLKDLSQAEWLSIAHQHLKRTGFEGCSYSVVLHPRNANHGQHIHIVASRSKNGQLVSVFNSYWRFRAALRVVEKEHGLEALNIPVDTPLAPTTAAVSAQRRANRNNATSSVWVSPEVILEQARLANSWDAFVARCAVQQIEVKLATRPTDQVVTGVLFKQCAAAAGSWLAGSTISRQCSFTNLQKMIALNVQVVAKNEQELSIQRQQAASQTSRKKQPSHASHERPRGG